MTVHIGWPQALWLAWTLFGLVFVVINHGKPRTKPLDAFDHVVRVILAIGLLAWGGFFS